MSLTKRIREAAAKGGSKIQTSDAAQLEAIFNKTFYLEKDMVEEVKFVEAVMTRGEESQERVGLHASAFIKSDKDFCVREQVLSRIYKQLQGREVPVGLKRIFEEGNAVHEKWQRLLIRGGYTDASLLDVTQMNEKYQISFTPDIICTVPEFYDGQMIGEIKSMNTFQYKNMIKAGKKHPSASKQLQWYMYLTGIHKGFVLVDDKNDQNFTIELYDYDEKIVQPYIDRAEKINYHYDRLISKGRMVKRPDDCNSPESKRCSKCVMKDACWGIGMGRVKIGE